MGFTDWPRELIFQVLSDDAIGLHESCSLVRVNRHLQKLVLPILYQSIQIDIPEPEAAEERKKALISLKNTVSENAELASLVQKLDVSWHFFDLGLPERYESYPEDRVVIDPDVERWINEILDHVPKLQTLVLERRERVARGRHLQPEAGEGTFDCSFLVGSKLGQLKELCLRGLNIGIHSTALAMRLPKLEVLEVERLAPNWPLEEKHNGIQSTVKELRLGPFCKPNRDMEKLLQWPTGLEELSYDLGIYMGRSQPPGPPTLSRLLTPHTNTLVYLNLSGADYTVIHMDSINFRLFSKLKKLTIANMLLFPCLFPTHQEQALYRNGLYKRLPWSIEHLEILFERGTSVLDPLYSPGRNFWIDEDYDWIEQLGINKDKDLPNLRSLILTEHSSCDWGLGPTDPSKLTEWDMPQSVKDAFTGKGVRVEILIRTEYFLKAYVGPKFRFRPSARRETGGTFVTERVVEARPHCLAVEVLLMRTR